MDELAQWPRTPELRQQYADHLKEEFKDLQPGQIAVMFSNGLTAIDRTGFSEFVGTPLIASKDPYNAPTKLYACQLVDLSARLMQDPHDKLDAVLQSYNASCDTQLGKEQRLFWSDVFRATNDYTASPNCIEVARSILHDPTRLFVEHAKQVLLAHWTAAVIDQAFCLLLKYPWTTRKGSAFEAAVRTAVRDSKVTPVRLAGTSEVLRRPIHTEEAAAAYAAACEACPDLIIFDPTSTCPIRPEALMLSKRDRIILALKLLLDTTIWKPILATVQDDKALPDGTPGCFAACCCCLYDHRRLYAKQG